MSLKTFCVTLEPVDGLAPAHVDSLKYEIRKSIDESDVRDILRDGGLLDRIDEHLAELVRIEVDCSDEA